MELVGVIINIGETETVGQKGFKKRLFAIETREQYPQKVQFELVQSNCDKIDQFAEGDTVRVTFDVRGREYTGSDGETKYFNSLNAWKISLDG